jgi:hypothetical protein
MSCKGCGGMKSNKKTDSQEDFQHLLVNLGVSQDVLENAENIKFRTIYYMNKWYVEATYDGSNYKIIEFV